jgi:hypothetical protein
MLAWESLGNQGANGVSAQTLTLSRAPTPGALLLAITWSALQSGSGQANLTTPTTGWTEIGAQVNQGVTYNITQYAAQAARGWWKVADGTEVSFRVNASKTADRLGLRVVEITGLREWALSGYQAVIGDQANTRIVLPLLAAGPKVKVQFSSHFNSAGASTLNLRSGFTQDGIDSAFDGNSRILSQYRFDEAEQASFSDALGSSMLVATA